MSLYSFLLFTVRHFFPPTHGLGAMHKGREQGVRERERRIYLLISNLGMATSMSVKYLFLLTSQGAGRGDKGRECREDEGGTCV